MFKKETRDGITYFISDIIPTPHAFSTRVGGVSCDPRTRSMNFGSSVEDGAVDKNIELFTSAAGLAQKVVRVKQIHSGKIAPLFDGDYTQKINESGFYFEDCDGFITNQKGISLCVRTADCLPVIMASDDGSVVCALHAGWRGSVALICKNAVALFDRVGVQPHRIKAALGPCISSCCFKVGGDFLSQFNRSDAAHLYPLVIKQRDGNHYCDLKKLNYLILCEAGVSPKNIDICPLCTHHGSDGLFFSHRKTGFDRGTMGNLISVID